MADFGLINMDLSVLFDMLLRQEEKTNHQHVGIVAYLGIGGAKPEGKMYAVGESKPGALNRPAMPLVETPDMDLGPVPVLTSGFFSY